MRVKALPVIQLEENAPGKFSKKYIDEINRTCAQMVEWVYGEVKYVHQDQKKCGLVGGDHSISEGQFSILVKFTMGIWEFAY